MKKNKDGSLPGNYRGITVTNKYSSIIESILKDRLENKLSPTQKRLQKGFTDRVSHLNIAFIVTECIMTCNEEDEVQWNNKLTDKIPLEQGIGKDQRYHL